jgi:hypothetical protein
MFTKLHVIFGMIATSPRNQALPQALAMCVNRAAGAFGYPKNAAPLADAAFYATANTP